MPGLGNTWPNIQICRRIKRPALSDRARMEDMDRMKNMNQMAMGHHNVRCGFGVGSVRVLWFLVSRIQKIGWDLEAVTETNERTSGEQ